MPVGKVFNAAENQVLISPVSSYYQGKAIRQSLADGEMDISLKKKTLEQADTKLDLEKKRVEQAEEEINLRKEAYAQARQQHEEEVGEKVAKKNAFDVWRITEGVNSAFASGGKTPEAESASLKLAEEKLTEYAKSLPDGEGKDKTLKMLEGGVTADEYRAILDMSNDNAAWYGFKEDRNVSQVSRYAALVDEDTGEVVYQDKENGAAPEKNPFGTIKPSDYTQESIKKFQVTGDYSDLVSKASGSTNKPPTAVQSKAGGFAIRIEEANKILEELDVAGVDFTNFADRISGSVMQGMKQEDRQKFEQAKRNYINAVLRRESGAAIAPSEFESAELQYFPQPGDTDASVSQKKRNRQLVESTLKAEAGPAMDVIRAQVKQDDLLRGDIASPKSKEEYDSLPSGKKYIAQDGSIKVKK